MSCRYKDECPSYSGWCEGPKQDFSKCIPFLISAYKNLKDIKENKQNKEKISGMPWAEREIALACKRETPNKQKGKFNYGCACYESALRAFESLCKDGHSGLSMDITKNILNRLIDHKPLTPIEDTDDVWSDCHFEKPNEITYQCNRMSSLFKTVYNNGSIKYSDVNRINCKNNGCDFLYHNSLVTKLIDEMFPIVMPYMPEMKCYTVYCEDFLVDSKYGDFDTFGILYAIKPNGERVEINRYFKEGLDSFIEIDADEYIQRKELKIK